jgi:riboflavin kinase/FMN adenylyltransferase
MDVLDDVNGCPTGSSGAVVTIGAYDGVHLGHRHIIGHVLSRAAELGSASGVVTFDRHPASVVRPQSAPKLLTDLEQKLELLAATGIDFTQVIHFDEQRSAESAEDFVTEVLVRCLRVQAVVVGHDFHFGHQRRGDVSLLERMGSEYGFDVTGMRLVGDGGTDRPGAGPVSSTLIRQLLAAGSVEEAAGLLGRPHEVRGVVQAGDRRGRELGFPTANVAVPGEIQLPADGIYAGWYGRQDGSWHPAALSLGRRPTFYDPGMAQPSLLEAYLLDFDGDLYGERAKVRFVTWLRGEERFESAEALAYQMERDVEATRKALGLG